MSTLRKTSRLSCLSSFVRFRIGCSSQEHARSCEIAQCFSRVAIRHKVERARGRKNCAELVQSTAPIHYHNPSRKLARYREMDAGVRTEFLVVAGVSSSCLPNLCRGNFRVLILWLPGSRRSFGDAMPLHALSRLRRASASQLRVGMVLGTIVSALVAPSRAQQARPAADPAKGFDPTRSGVVITGSRTTVVSVAPTTVIEAKNVIPLPQHGNANGGKDQGLNNLGIIFGARVYGKSLVTGLDLFYYVPSSRDNYYREGDYRGTLRRIGGDGDSLGRFFCPAGYAAVGLQGAAGLGIDRLGLICGKIGNPSQGTDLPILGGRGGNPFKDTCNTTSSTGYLTGVRVRAGVWIDSIQGFCQVKD